MHAVGNAEEGIGLVEVPVEVHHRAAGDTDLVESMAVAGAADSHVAAAAAGYGVDNLGVDRRSQDSHTLLEDNVLEVVVADNPLNYVSSLRSSHGAKRRHVTRRRRSAIGSISTTLRRRISHVCWLDFVGEQNIYIARREQRRAR